ncbi:DUF6086 family protein [Streptomyces sp. NPDC047014]|uniref:DUF6086 family protein n=1 Tax=Streptomyces sp. NPDC047014 TaxID=3155736 RepID=UPI0033D51437
MSQYFDLGDEMLWNSSNGVSRMFQRQVALFEAELGIPSGVGPMENDECQVSSDSFETFVHALLAQHRRASHSVWLALHEGFAATVLVLAERAGLATGIGMAAPTEGAAWAAGLCEKARELDRVRPR